MLTLDRVARPHAPTKIGTRTLGYDANGNMVSDGVRSLAWDRSKPASAAVAGVGVAVGTGMVVDGAKTVAEVFSGAVFMKGKSSGEKSPGRLNKEIERGLSPKGVKRVDLGLVKGEQAHVHFKDVSALNKDGTWKHGGKMLSREEKHWLESNGWRTPK